MSFVKHGHASCQHILSWLLSMSLNKSDGQIAAIILQSVKNKALCRCLRHTDNIISIRDLTLSMQLAKCTLVYGNGLNHP